MSVDRLLRDAWDLSNTGTSVDIRTSATAWYFVGASMLFLPAAVRGPICLVLIILTLAVPGLIQRVLRVQVPNVLGAHFSILCWSVVAVLSFLAVSAYLAYSVMAPELYRRLEKCRLDRYFRYNMVRSFAFYSNRCEGALILGWSLSKKIHIQLYYLHHLCDSIYVTLHCKINFHFQIRWNPEC